MVLNELVSDYGLAYDDKGSIARSGKIYPSLLHKLNALAFYRQDPPKSLGKEWYLSEFEPLLKASEIATKDKLRTAVEHISIQLTQSFIPGKVFLTGGGAHNSFLIERIQINSSNDVIIPDSTIVDFKEAIIFAYLGHLRLLDKKNVLSSVTGARRDHSAGNISLP
jgi:anhydro-N-acetylmuramic acid kinase